MYRSLVLDTLLLSCKAAGSFSLKQDKLGFFVILL